MSNGLDRNCGKVYTVQYSEQKGEWIVKGDGSNKSFESKEDAIHRAKVRTTIGDTVHIKNKVGFVVEGHTRREYTPLLGFFKDT